MWKLLSSLLLVASLGLISFASSPAWAFTAPSVPLLGRSSSCCRVRYDYRKSDFTTTTTTTKKFAGPPAMEPNDDDDALAAATRQQLKNDLLLALTELRSLRERDGDFSDIDWGTKGGELTEAGRVPRRVDYYKISDDVGRAATRVMAICDQLALVSPTPIPTLFLGDKQDGPNKAPLHGAWKLLFTNAADAVFSRDSKRGAAKLQNIVDAARGRITNIIDFETNNDDNDKDGKKPPAVVLKQLNVVIQAKAVNDKRVELNFKYAKVVLTKFFFVPLFGRKLSLYIPCHFFYRRPGVRPTHCTTFGKKNSGEKRTTKGYFDVLYLDSQLRVHKTGQDNLFVQAKDDWKEATPLLQ